MGASSGSARLTWTILLLLVPTAGASAQQSPAHIASLELKVDAADLVVRGIVTSVQRAKAAQTGQLRTTVRVLETLKGKHRDTLEFTESDPASDGVTFIETYLNDWRSKGYEFLWFFDEVSDVPGGLVSSRELAWSRVVPIPLVADMTPLTPSGFSSLFQTGYLTATLRFVTQPGDLLDEVRRAASRTRTSTVGQCPPYVAKVYHTILDDGCEVGLPYDVIALTGRSGDGYVQYLHVPNDERMEALCRRMVERPADVWALAATVTRPGWRVAEDQRLPLVREQGVRCLQAFRSDRNIALLRSILEERRPQQKPEPSSGRTLPSFDERQAASDVLRSWEVAAP